MLHGNQVAFRFLGARSQGAEDLTWSNLLQLAENQAGHLADLRGCRVGLLCHRPRDFVVSLVATILAGAITVPLPAILNRRSAEHIHAIIKSADLAAVIAPGEMQQTSWLWSRGTRILPIERLRSPAPQSLNYRAIPLDDPFLIQFTSGSTGTPRGVALSHANALANCAAIVDAYGLGPNDVGLSWLPLHHDMGLIGHVLTPIWVGGRSVIMDPLRFMQRPMSWLEAIGRERATITSAPNFAYQLCSRAAVNSEIRSLDLSSVSTLVCGGEPAIPETLNEFISRFERFGLRREVLAPSYGLAEATLLVSTGKGPEGPAIVNVRQEESGRLVQKINLGAPVPGTQVRIVRLSDREELAQGQIGEIEIAGASVGRILGAPPDKWTRTGDLGMIADDGGLVVTGRTKDVLIVRGRNLQVTDVEAATVSLHAELIPGGTAAIGVEREGTQALVVVAELRQPGRRALDKLRGRIREVVANATGHVPEQVVFAKVGMLPRTTSGKLRRDEITALYLKGAFSSDFGNPSKKASTTTHA